MNEQFKELALQMGWEEIGANLYGKPLDGCMTAYALEKFAQLIVSECINIVKPTSHHQAYAPSYLGGVDGLELLTGKISDIKNKFGITQ